MSLTCEVLFSCLPSLRSSAHSPLSPSLISEPMKSNLIRLPAVLSANACFLFFFFPFPAFPAPWGPDVEYDQIFSQQFLSLPTCPCCICVLQPNCSRTQLRRPKALRKKKKKTLATGLQQYRCTLFFNQVTFIPRDSRWVQVQICCQEKQLSLVTTAKDPG